ncbi:MAG: patatin-like phospholipase family protein [Acidimicrobiales bacterium]|nr:patatin-like phospholipase family protein [Acidimicrobiales bacterium]
MGRFAALRQRFRPRGEGTIFVLSGGAVRGAAQVGMLRAVLEHGIVPDQVVGVSAGALNGLVLASDPTLERLSLLEEVWAQAAEKSPIRGSVLRNIAAIIRGQPSFDNGERLRELIADNVPVDDISQTKIPFHLATTAASTGRHVWWQEGPSVDLLCASAAMPGVLPAVELSDGDLHIDGGVVSNIPLRYALSLEPARLVVFDVAARFLPPEKQTALSVMMTGFRAAAAELTRQQWRDVPAWCSVLHLRLPLDNPGIDDDFNDAPKLMELGYAEAQDTLAQQEDF